MSNYINPTAPVVSLQRMLNALSPELQIGRAHV